jgi:hypothetical protein
LICSFSFHQFPVLVRFGASDAASGERAGELTVRVALRTYEVACDDGVSKCRTTLMMVVVVVVSANLLVQRKSGAGASREILHCIAAGPSQAR